MFFRVMKRIDLAEVEEGVTKEDSTMREWNFGSFPVTQR